MEDQLAGQPEGGASASAPAAPGIDIEAIKAQMRAEMDERVRGLQRVVGSKDDLISALRSENSQLKTAGLSEEEREQLEIEQVREENRQLQSRLALEELAAEYGTEVPFFRRLLASDNAEDQLKVMREYAQSRQPKAPDPKGSDPAADDLDVPDVDLNKGPRRTSSAQGTAAQYLPDGTLMTEELADRLLSSVSRQADVTQRRIRPSL